MKWEILIATLGRRGDRFQRLMDTLLPQVDQAEGEVRVTALWNNGERPLSMVRQDLLDSATGEYVSWIDDDDDVPSFYVERVLPLLDGVDYIGWRMQYWDNGRQAPPTFHSLRYQRWSEDRRGYYRDISHLNPIRRELAVQARFHAEVGTAVEDWSWALDLRNKGIVKTEHFIDDVMYHYRHNSRDSVQNSIANSRRRIRTGRPQGMSRNGMLAAAISAAAPLPQPKIDSPYFSYHPASSRDRAGAST